MIVANIHPGQDALAAMLAGAAQARRRGGYLYVVGHHVASLGRHGPFEALATRDRPGDHDQGDRAATADTVVAAWATKPEAPGGQR